MLGWLQTSGSNPAFSNVNSNDLIMRTNNATDKVVIGSGKNPSSNATLYITNNSLGINGMPASNMSLDVQGVFQVGTDSNVYVANTLTASNAAISNLSVGTLTYANATANDLAASNFTAVNTTAQTATACNLSASNATVATNLVVGSGIYPSSNNGATLGNSSNRFQDLWLGGQSFHIGDTTLSQEPNGNLIITDNTETVLKSMVADTVQIGASSNYNLELAQSDQGEFVVYQLSNGVRTQVNIVENIFTVGSNVGVGQSNPSQALDVAGNLLVEGEVLLESGTILREGSNSTLLVNPDGVYGTVNVQGTQMLVQNRLGISTSSPQYALDVSGFARLTNLMLSGNQLPFLVYNDYSDSNQNIPWYGISVPSFNSNTFITGKAGITLLTSNMPVVIDSKCAGLGIGTSNVHTLLQFTNADNIRKLVLQELNNNQYQVMGIGSSSNTFVLQVPSQDNRFTFFSAVDGTMSQELLSVQGNGNVKVGQGQAAYNMDVDGIVKTSTMLLLGDSVDTETTGRVISAADSLLQPSDTLTIGVGKTNEVCNQGIITYQHVGDYSTSNVMILGLSGFDTLGVSANGVGINTTSPLYDLDVRGQIYANGDSIFASNVSVFGTVQTQNLTAFGSSNNVLNIGSDSNTDTINIGGSNKTINIGGAGDIVNIQGSLTWIDTVNTVTTDKTIVINQGGATGTAINCGLQFHENSNVAGYILVNSTDDGFVMEAPASSNVLSINLLSNISFNNALFIAPANSNVGFGSASNPLYNVHIQNSNTPTLFVETLSNDTATIVLANTNARWAFNGPVFGSNNALQLCYQSNLNGYVSYMTVANNGNIGFGTDSPQYALDVAGTINATGILVNGQQISSGGAVAGGGGGASGWASQSSNIYTDCNVGIKQHNPRYELDVSGTVNAQSFYVNGSPFTAGYWSVGQGYMYSLSNVGINVSSPAYTLDVGGTINCANITVNGGSIASGFWQLSGGNVYSLSNVGVGTSIPTKALDVVGDARVTGNFNTTQLLTAGSMSVTGNAGVTGNLTVTGALKQNSLVWGDGLIFNSGNNRFYADAGLGSVVLNVDVKSNLLVSAGQSPVLFANGSNGFVGINNSNPLFQFDVSGTIHASNYANVPWSGLVNVPAFQSVATSGSYLDLNHAPALCNVCTSGSYLDLNHAPALCNVATSGSYLDLNHAPALCNVATSASYFDLTDRPSLCNVATTGQWSDITVPNGLTDVARNNLSNFAQTVVFQQKVGIANGSPAYALDVIGTVNATSYRNVSYTDLVNAPALCNVAITSDFTSLHNIQPLSYFANDLSSFSCNVGINIAIPQYTLHVGGAVYASAYCNLDWSMVQNAPNFARPSYSNLVDAPQHLSELINDLTCFTCNVGFGGNSNPLYAVDVVGAVNATSYCNVNWSNLVDAPALCNVATTGSWSDINHKPPLSALVNDLTYFGCNVGILNPNPNYPLSVNGAIYATTYCNVAWSNLVGAPTLCNVATTSRYQDIVNTPSNLSQFNNDLSNFDSLQVGSVNVTRAVSAASYCNMQWSNVLNAPAFTTNYNLLSNKPALCNVALSARYSDIVGTPALCNVAIFGLYSSLPDIPNLAPIAYVGSNSYHNLIDTPSLSTVAQSGDYNDLTNKPTNMSQFTNDLSNFTNLVGEGDTHLEGTLTITDTMTVSNVAVFDSDTQTYGTVYASKITALEGDNTMFIGCSSNIDTIYIGNNSKTGHLINIGTTSAPGMSNVITIGGPTDTVYIPGGLVYVYESFLYTSNHTFTLNEGGQPGSSAGAGIFFDEAHTIVGYMQLSSDRKSYLMQTPTSTNDTILDMTGNQLTINEVLTVASDSSNVGIGTTTPTEKFQVQGGNIRIHNPSSANGQTNSFLMSHSNTATAADIGSYYKNGNIDLRYYTYSNGNQILNTVMSGACVGIGTNAPSVPLHVNGDISFNSTIYYQYENSNTWSNVNVIDVPQLGTVNYYVPSSIFGDAILTLKETGCVGIGSTSPSQTLDVSGTIGTQNIISTGGYAVNNVASTTTDNCPTDGLGYNASNNVQLNAQTGITLSSDGPLYANVAHFGIGTNTPAQDLHVIGNVLVSSNLTVDYIVSNKTVTTNLLSASNVAACNIDALSNLVLSIQQTGIRTSNLAYSNVWSTTNNGINTTTQGSVGIGTTTPQYPLHVLGTVSASSYCNITYDMVSGTPTLSPIAYYGSNTYSNLTGTPSLCNIATSSLWSDLNGKPSFATVATTGQYSDLSGSPTTLSNFTNNLTLFPNQITFCNSVGILTNVPNYALDVCGTVNACNMLINGQPLSSVIVVGGYWQYNAAYEYTFSNVGFGLTSPQTALSVGTDFSMTPCNNAWTTVSGKSLYMRYSTWSNQDAAYIKSYDHTNGKYYNMNIQASNIQIGQGSLTNPALFVGYNGSIGVGTSSPTQVLDVNGAINAISYCNVSYCNLLNRPTYALVANSGKYSDLSNLPTYALIANSGKYSDLSNVPNFAPIAFTGSNTWANLTGTPTNLSYFTNDISAFYTPVSFTSNMSFANSNTNRTIVLFDQVPSNSNQFSGFGINNNGSLRYQTADVTKDHIFYSGVSSNASSELMRVLGTGRVGIGTSSPSQLFHVCGGSVQVDNTTTPVLSLISSGTNVANAGEIQMYQSTQQNGWKIRNIANSNALSFISWSNSTEYTRMFISSNVGIKTSAPLYDLDVNGTVNATNYIGVSYSMLSGTPSFSALAFSGSNTWSNLNGKPTSLSYFTNDLSNFGYNTIFSSNVGIGVLTPSVALDVAGGTINCAAIQLSGSNMTLSDIKSGGTLNVGSDTATTTLNLGSGANVTTVNVATNVSSTTTINLGTSTDTVNIPAANLTLGATSLGLATGLLTLNSAGALNSATGCGFQIYENSNATAYIKTSGDRASFLMKTPAGSEMSLNLSGNNVNINNNALFIGSIAGSNAVGIGTNSPTQTLQVMGNIQCTSVLTTSDARLKKNIRNIDDSMEKLSQIDGVYFDWKDTGKNNAGVLAQQVKDVLPEAVHGEDEMSVDYSCIVALCINAIKEQQREIQELKRMIMV